MLITITGASGVGKSAVRRRVRRQTSGVMALTSTTNRKPSERDDEGDYEYITDHVFTLLERMNAFLWTVEAHGNRYGTRAKIVHAALLPRFRVVADLKHDAVVRLHEFARENGLAREVRSIYILSPGVETLRARLEKRERYPDPNDVARRLEECIPWDNEARASDIPYIFFQDTDNMDTKVRLVRSLLTDRPF